MRDDGVGFLERSVQRHGRLLVTQLPAGSPIMARDGEAEHEYILDDENAVVRRGVIFMTPAMVDEIRREAPGWDGVWI